MEYTNGNLRLAKPQLSDIPDITRMNPNWDKIDENISSFDSKINVLSDETLNIGFGKKNKPATVTSYKQLPAGRWFGNLTDAPKSGYCYYDVYVGDNQSYKHIVCKPWGENETYYNQNINGSWAEWRQASTNNKSEVLLTPKANYTISSQNSYQINNILHINVDVKRNDSSSFTGGQFINGLTIPFSVSNTSLNITCSSGGFFKVGGTAIAYDTNIAFTPANDCTAIRISGEVVL